ncbi:MAG: tripartite tricarboxylate transporter substrate binding protein [Thermodesulfobacteriota bacterium]
MTGAKTRTWVVVLLGLVVCVLPRGVWAQTDYPSKTVEMVCPYPAGGSSDLFTRVVADKFKEYTGQPFVVLNKPGAGTALAAGYVANAKPDGYTLYSAAAGVFVYLHVLNPGFTTRLSDFAAIGATAKYPQIAVAYKDVPVSNLKEMVAYIKKNPGKLSYCSVGVASAGHLLWESLKHAEKLDIQHIPYPGFAPSLTALVGGQADFAIFPFSSLVIKQADAKAIKILAVMGDKSEFLPNTPTSAEQGYPDLKYDSYLSILAPAKTPQAVIKKLESMMEKALQEAPFRQKVKDLAFETDFLNAEKTLKYLSGEIRWGEVIKKANIITK